MVVPGSALLNHVGLFRPDVGPSIGFPDDDKRGPCVCTSSESRTVLVPTSLCPYVGYGLGLYPGPTSVSFICLQGGRHRLHVGRFVWTGGPGNDLLPSGPRRGTGTKPSSGGSDSCRGRCTSSVPKELLRFNRVGRNRDAVNILSSIL